MPFGIKTAPSRFQRYVNEVVRELIDQGTLKVYMDDFLLANETIEEHVMAIHRLFELLVENKLQLRINKCKFLYTTIDYLGYTISHKGISPNSRGVETILKFPMPLNVHDIRTFIGLCSYFRKFIGKFSIIAKPLYDPMRKNTAFKFGDKEVQAFQFLKNELTKAPILALYSPHDETEMHCDASLVGYGAILMQRKEDSKMHPIFYFSKRTTATENRYHSFELKMLAMH